VEFFSGWVDDKLPTCWWLPAMTYPTGFLTAVLQVAARANGVSIDSLSYETPVTGAYAPMFVHMFIVGFMFIVGLNL
jgi:hypothetical protein